MKNMPRLLATAALLAAACYAQAVPLITNVTVGLPGTTSAAEPQLAGVVLEDWVQPFSFTVGRGTISGTVQSRVVRSDLDGTLDFYWRVINDPNSVGSIGAFRLGNFVAPEYNANWRIDGLGSAIPANAHMFPGPAGFINFLFNSTTPGATLTPGSGSYFMLMDTTATNYAKTAIYDLTGGDFISGEFQTFAPAPVPEPAAYGMLLAGLAAVGLAAKRRRS